VILRPAAAGEAPALAALHARAFDAPWGAAEIADLMAGPGAFALVAETQAPAGFVLCRAAAGEAEILTLAVDPRARRAGLARALVAAAADLARRLGAEELFLEVAADNAAALGLYGAVGFVRAGLRPRYYDRGAAGFADALVMRLDLSAGRP